MAYRLGNRILKIDNKLFYSQGTAVFPVNGLTSYWRLDEVGGTIAVDRIASYSATTNNTSIWNVSGKNNGCIDCAGSYYVGITATDSNLLYTSTGLTVSLWHYWDGSKNNRNDALIDKGGTSGNRILRLGFADNDNNHYRVLLGDASGGWSYTSSPALTGITTGWNHVVLVFRGSVGFKLYVNGVLGANADVSHSTTLKVGGTTGFLIGGGSNSSNNPDYFYLNKIDEVGIWNRALTPTEVATLYNSGNGLFY